MKAGTQLTIMSECLYTHQNEIGAYKTSIWHYHINESKPMTMVPCPPLKCSMPNNDGLKDDNTQTGNRNDDVSQFVESLFFLSGMNSSEMSNIFIDSTVL